MVDILMLITTDKENIARSPALLSQKILSVGAQSRRLARTKAALDAAIALVEQGFDKLDIVRVIR